MTSKIKLAFIGEIASFKEDNESFYSALGGNSFALLESGSGILGNSQLD